jgi:hypothetical protein
MTITFLTLLSRVASLSGTLFGLWLLSRAEDTRQAVAIALVTGHFLHTAIDSYRGRHP